MRTKTNLKRRRLVALFAAILAIAGALALMPNIATATEGTPTNETGTPAGETGTPTGETGTPTNGAVLTPQAEGDTPSGAGEGTPSGAGENGETTETTGTLEVTVATDPTDDTVEFKFTVEGKDDVTLEPIADGYDVVAEGGAFTLKNGQKAGFTVKAGATYTVSQTVVDGWEVTEPEGASTEVTVEENKTETVTFSNKKEAVTPEVTTKVTPSTIPNAKEDTKSDITDEVTLSNLEAGKKYIIEGELYLHSTKAGTGVTATAEATAGDDGTATATLKYENVEVGKYIGDKLVSFVKVKLEGEEVCSHEDIEDADQTVTITSLANSLTISKSILTPATDAAIARAQSYVDEAKDESEKKAAQEWLDELVDHRDGNTEKSITGAKDKEFTFTVKLTDSADKELEGEFTLLDKDGKAVTDVLGTEKKIKSGDTVTLKHDESVTIADLPTGTKYEVVETEADNWVCDQEKNTVSGEIKEDEGSTAAFVNTGKGSFTVSKSIKGYAYTSHSEEVKNTDFTFTVNFYDRKDQNTRKDLEGEFAYTGDHEGTIKSGETITLKGGEGVTFDVDPGVYVRVSEAAVANWTPSNKNLAGAIYDGKSRSADFTNTYSESSSSSSKASTAKTGTTGTTRAATANTADPTTIAPLAMGALSMALVGAGAVSRRRK